MPLLQYPYQLFPNDPDPRPMALGLAINTLNGRWVEFVGILDTGADQTSLSKSLLQDLDIDPQSLTIIPVGGAEGPMPALYCDFIRIAFLELPLKQERSPNGHAPVPVHFSQGPFNLLGRELFLNLCRVCFDGPNRVTTVEF